MFLKDFKEKIYNEFLTKIGVILTVSQQAACSATIQWNHFKEKI